MVLLALYDQSRPARELIRQYPEDAAFAAITADTVQQLERRICSRCMVFQLPETTFPTDGFLNGMLPYDNSRAQLYSQTLHWSWPAFTQERVQWGKSLRVNDPQELVRQLAVAGFQAIWLDRSGYASPVESPETGLVRVLGPPAVVSKDKRVVVFDIRPVTERAGNGVEREKAVPRH
jgi:phosphoglycerol transferase